VTEPARCRLIVTGSREYDDEAALRARLAGIFAALPPGTLLVVMCGSEEDPDYLTGPERIAQFWALECDAMGLAVVLEGWPAGWEEPCREECEPGHRRDWEGREVCPDAGLYRNRRMCESGADAGLAALRVGTAATLMKDCVRHMLRRRIPVEVIVQGRAQGLPQAVVESVRRAGDRA
jgi:hypothetical protein